MHLLLSHIPNPKDLLLEYNCVSVRSPGSTGPMKPHITDPTQQRILNPDRESGQIIFLKLS